MKRIPAFAAGILFSASFACLAGGLDLALELFEDEDWPACRRECLRELVRDPGYEPAALFHALAALRVDRHDTNAVSVLERLSAESRNPETRALAALELDRVRRPEGAGSLADAPARCLVAFYRGQIAPAIGQRCSLHPSCSEYFLQASEKHGLLGVPMQADRLVREPGVVAAAERPVVVNGRERYADPVSDHDSWMMSEER